MSKHSFSEMKTNYGTGTAILIYIIAIAIVLGFAFGLVCLEAWIGMLLWNAVMPHLFTIVNPITFWQMMGFNLLLSFATAAVWGRVFSALIKD